MTLRTAIAAAAVVLQGAALGQAPTSSIISVNSSGVEGNSYAQIASISPQGKFVAFTSTATNMIPADANGFLPDVFIRDRINGITTLASVSSGGLQANDDSAMTAGALSASGAYLAFQSRATNLVTPDTNGTWDVFVHTRLTGQTVMVSVSSAGVQGNGQSTGAFISAQGDDRGTLGPFDGRFVVFVSQATNLVAGDTNGVADVFVHDRDADGDFTFDQPGGISTIRASVSSSGAEATGASSHGTISSDGSRVAFWSFASNLVANDTNGAADVFVHDLVTGQTVRASVSSSGQQANDDWVPPVGPAPITSLQISGDGRYVTFFSYASNLAPNDTNGAGDVFVHDLQTGTTAIVSVSSAGGAANGDSRTMSISSDGRSVGFTSFANNLAPGAAAFNLYVRDRDTDSNGVYDEAGGVATTLAGALEFAAPPAGGPVAMSPAGSCVAYSTTLAMTAADGNSTLDIYLTDTTRDTDSDGLLDAWEYVGLDSNADGTLDSLSFLSPAVVYSPAFGGSDPMHKDMYLELDAMQGRTPTSNLSAVGGAFFAAAPVSNPDGQPGINLRTQGAQAGVIVLDETNIPLATWTWPPPQPPMPPEFAPLKLSRFGTVAERNDPNWAAIRAAKLRVYRYGVFADRLGTTTISGVAEQVGNDFCVTLGAWPLASLAEWGVFMHELGHCLGLSHGGGDTINFKPNYHSVMNYSWTVPVLANPYLFQSWILDFSSAAWPTLDESNLNEAAGAGGHPGHWVPFGTTVTCTPPVPPNPAPVPAPWTTPEWGPADWNLDGNMSGTGVQQDLNYVVADANQDGLVNCNDPSPGQMLVGFNDWANLVYPLVGPNYAASPEGGAPEVPQELTLEIYQALSEIGACPADLDGDGAVGITDLLAMLAAWGTDPGGPPDLDGDGIVGITDLLELLSSWGPCG